LPLGGDVLGLGLLLTFAGEFPVPVGNVVSLCDGAFADEALELV